jgi:hypothetical protein
MGSLKYSSGYQSPSNGIKANGGIRYGGVVQARTRIPEVGSNVQSVSMDESRSSKRQRLMAWACTRVFLE